MEIKGLVCCKLANLIGDLWLALLLATVFAVATAAAVFAFLAQLDALPQRGCVASSMRFMCEASPALLSSQIRETVQVKRKHASARQ